MELETEVDEKLIGGFVLEFNNNLVDASILRDLKDIKKQFTRKPVRARHALTCGITMITITITFKRR
jgi:hypothetical protein